MKATRAHDLHCSHWADHVGLTASSRNELESWANWFAAHGVTRFRDQGGGGGWMFDLVNPDGQLEFLFFDEEGLRSSDFLSPAEGLSTGE